MKLDKICCLPNWDAAYWAPGVVPAYQETSFYSTFAIGYFGYDATGAFLGPYVCFC